MGELIRRGLTPGVGQNPLSKWLASPELLSPVKTQSTELLVTQTLRDFQAKVRYHQDAQTLVGVETTVSFDVTVPIDERWWIEWLFVEHDSVAARAWRVRVLRNPFFNRQAIIAQRTLTPGAMRPLIGGRPIQPTVAASEEVYPSHDYIAMPGENIEIRNITAMAAGEVGRIQVRYRNIPEPLELENARVGLWQATTL